MMSTDKDLKGAESTDQAKASPALVGVSPDLLNQLVQSNLQTKEAIQKLAPKGPLVVSNEMVKANKGSGNEILARESNLAHVLIWVPQHDMRTGKPKFSPNPQKFDINEWKNFLAHPNGNVVKEYIHLPEGFQSQELFEKEKAEKAKA